jgi:hypothetical protein
LLDIDGQKVSYAQVDGKNYDMATGLNPLNVQITPDGKLAIVNNIGGGQDGQVDTVGIIDLEASPPRVIDQVVVGDGRASSNPNTVPARLTQTTSSMEALMREPNALISTDALARELGGDNLRVFDCTTYLEPPPPGSDDPYLAVPGRSSFETAHIPGADFLDIQGEFSDNALDAILIG